MGEGRGVGGHRSRRAVICGVGSSSPRGGHSSFWKQKTAQWRQIQQFGSVGADLFVCSHAGRESPARSGLAHELMLE